MLAGILWRKTAIRLLTFGDQRLLEFAEGLQCFVQGQWLHVRLPDADFC